ncbi:PT domain-containing protein [Oceaniferula flava]|uniref:PT domain-containing protein n=1 Tax=Oceaniferula flava TaxID=2800421 RepID=UPI002867E34A|nr:PT domain-containing protein [Oceaniferula flavus]
MTLLFLFLMPVNAQHSLTTGYRAPANQPINQSTNQPINQSTNQPINQSTNQPINQSTSQPVNQSTSQPAISHSRLHWGGMGFTSFPDEKIPTDYDDSTGCWLFLRSRAGRKK